MAVMEMLDYSELRSLAVAVGVEAAELVRRRRSELVAAGDLDASAHTKSSDVDPVTVVDKESEELITRLLLERRPGDGIVGEEGADVVSQSSVRWIVDPIDGTVNFLYGLPHYAVSIAAAVGGEVVAGAVVNAATGTVYSAHAGGGATVTRGGGGDAAAPSALRASSRAELSTTLVATGFSYSAEWRAKQAELLGRILPNVRDIRRAGSAALDLCAVANGTVDAYYEHGTHPWDYAAGALVAAEAGARVRHPGLDASGYSGGVTVAAAPGVWTVFHELLERSGANRPLSGGDSAG